MLHHSSFCPLVLLSPLQAFDWTDYSYLIWTLRNKNSTWGLSIVFGIGPCAVVKLSYIVVAMSQLLGKNLVRAKSVNEVWKRWTRFAEDEWGGKPALSSPAQPWSLSEPLGSRKVLPAPSNLKRVRDCPLKDKEQLGWFPSTSRKREGSHLPFFFSVMHCLLLLQYSSLRGRAWFMIQWKTLKLAFILSGSMDCVVFVLAATRAAMFTETWLSNQKS